MSVRTRDKFDALFILGQPLIAAQRVRIAELVAIEAKPDRPFNVGFFCHAPLRLIPGAKRHGGGS
jgi:hypothetical protein